MSSVDRGGGGERGIENSTPGPQSRKRTPDLRQRSDTPRDIDELRQQLPLPLARLATRATRAQTALERHNAAFYLWEASLKLMATVALVEYAAQEQRQPELQEVLQKLSRPALGDWWRTLREVTQFLSQRGLGVFAELEQFLLKGRHRDLPRAAGLDAKLRQVSQGSPETGATVRLYELFDRLVKYRNDEFGHGGSGMRPTEFYDEVGECLAAGAADFLRRWDVLCGCRLIHVGDVRQLKSGAWLIERSELVGLEAQRIEPLELHESQTSRLPRTQCLYLHPAAAELSDPRGLLPDRLLYPLLDANENCTDVGFLNAQRGKGRAEFLAYSTGQHSSETLILGLCELLSRLLGQDVRQEDVDQWAANVAAEESEEKPPATAAVVEREPRRLGEYELRSVLGHGGMGKVYRAWQPSLGRDVALKRLYGSGDPKAQRRFQKELLALGRVRHPHVVEVYHSGNDGVDSYYVMELLEGADLARICRHLAAESAREEQGRQTIAVNETSWDRALTIAISEAQRAEHENRLDGESAFDEPAESGIHRVVTAGRIDSSPASSLQGSHAYVARIVEIGRQVALGLQALHEAGVIHRDVKPANIMITTNGRAVLTDLGLAKLEAESHGGLATTKGFLGTVRYASPEQLQSPKDLDQRTDIYSLGVALWELLALRPFMGIADDTPVPEVARILREDPEPVRKYARHVPGDLDAIVMKCIDHNESRRYSTASELADDLNRWLQGEPVLARPPSFGLLFRRKLRQRRKQVAAGAAAVAGLLLIVISLVAMQLRTAKNEAEQARREAEVAASAAAEAAENATLAAFAAEEARMDAARRAAELSLVRAESQLAAGDWSGAMLWYADAARWEETGQPERSAAHLRLVGDGLRHAPALERVWRPSSELRRLCVGPGSDDEILAVAVDGGIWRLGQDSQDVLAPPGGGAGTGAGATGLWAAAQSTGQILSVNERRLQLWTDASVRDIGPAPDDVRHVSLSDDGSCFVAIGDVDETLDSPLTPLWIGRRPVSGDWMLQEVRLSGSVQLARLSSNAEYLITRRSIGDEPGVATVAAEIWSVAQLVESAQRETAPTRPSVPDAGDGARTGEAGDPVSVEPFQKIELTGLDLVFSSDGANFVGVGGDSTLWRLVNDEDNDSLESSAWFAEGEADARGVIEPGSDVDYWRFVSPKSGTLVARMDADGSEIDSYLSVYDAEGTQIGSNDDYGGGRNSLLVFSVAEGESYYIQAASYASASGSGRSGAYRLSLFEEQHRDDVGDTSGTAAALQAGERLLVGRIDSAGDVDAWRFVAEEPGPLTLSVTALAAPDGSGSGVDPVLKLFNAAGDVVAEDDDGGEGLNCLLTVTLEQEQPYLFAVSDVGTGMGEYLVSLAYGDMAERPDEAGDDLATAAGLTSGVRSVVGRIASAGDVDAWRFVAEESGPLTVDVRDVQQLAGGNWLLDPVVRVHGGGGESLGENDDRDGASDSRDSRLTISVVEGQTYAFLVSSYSGAGDYLATLTYGREKDGGDDAGDSAAQATTLPDGARSVVGRVNSSSDVDVWRFVAGESGPLIIHAIDVKWLDGIERGVDPVLKLYSAAGELLAMNDDSGGGLDSRLSAEFVQDQSYLIEVSTAGTGGTGDYIVLLTRDSAPKVDEAGDEPASAMPIPPGSATTFGWIETPNDRDVYRFEAERSGSMSIDMTALAGGLDCYLEVLSQAGGSIASNDDRTTGVHDSHVEFNVSEGALYFIVASSFSGSTGSYLLRQSVPQSSLVLAAPPVGSASGGGQRKWVGQPLDYITRVRAAAFRSDGRHMAAFPDTGLPGIWDCRSGQQLLTLPHAGAQRGVFSPDDRWLATAGTDGVRIWDAATGTAQFPLLRTSGGCTALAFSRTGSQLFAAGAQGDVLAWRLGHSMASPPCDSFVNIDAITAADGGAQFLLLESDGVLRLSDGNGGERGRCLGFLRPGTRKPADAWDVGQTGVGGVNSYDWLNNDDWLTPPDPVPGIEDPVASTDAPQLTAAFSPDRRRVAVYESEDELVLYPVAEQDARPVRIRLPAGQLNHVAWSADGRFVAGDVVHDDSLQPFGGLAEELWIWDTSTGDIVDVFTPLWNVNRLSFDSGGALVAAEHSAVEIWTIGGDDNEPRHVDAPENATGIQTAHLVDGGGRLLAQIGITDFGAGDAWGSSRTELWLYDLENGEWAKLQHLQGIQGSLLIAREGTEQVLSWNEDGKAYRWDLGGRMLCEYPHAEPLRGVAYSPDRDEIVTWSDRSVRVWEARTGLALSLPLIAPLAIEQAGITVDGDVWTICSGTGRSLLFADRSKSAPSVGELLEQCAQSDGREIDDDGERIVLIEGSGVRTAVPDATGHPEPAAWHRQQFEQCLGTGAWVAADQHLNWLEAQLGRREPRLRIRWHLARDAHQEAISAITAMVSGTASMDADLRYARANARLAIDPIDDARSAFDDFQACGDANPGAEEYRLAPAMAAVELANQVDDDAAVGASEYREAADRLLSLCLNSRPDDAGLLRQRALIRARCGRWDEAMTDAAEFCRNNPGFGRLLQSDVAASATAGSLDTGLPLDPSLNPDGTQSPGTRLGELEIPREHWPRLGEFLNDPDPYVQLWAAAIAPDEAEFRERAGQAMLALVSSSSSVVRRYAIRNLLDSPDLSPDTITVLAGVLTSGVDGANVMDLVQAGRLFRLMLPHLAESAESLDVMRALIVDAQAELSAGDVAAFLQSTAVRTHPGENLDGIVLYLADHWDWTVRQELARGVRNLPLQQETRDTVWLSLLFDADADVRAAAITNVATAGRFRGGFFDILAARGDAGLTTDVSTRTAAIRATAALAPNGRFAAALKNALADREPDVRRAALETAVNRPSIVPRIQDDVARRLRTDGDETVRIWAAYVLGLTTSDNDDAFDALTVAMNDSSPSVQIEAAAALLKLQLPGPRLDLPVATLDLLLLRIFAGLDDGPYDAAVRLLGLVDLSGAGPDALSQLRAAAPALRDRLSHVDAAVRLHAVRSLGLLGADPNHPDELTLAALESRIHPEVEEDVSVRHAAIEALCLLNRPDVLSSILSAPETWNPEDVIAAVNAARRVSPVWETDPALLDWLIAALSHEDPAVGQQAADLLGRSGPAAQGAVTPLQQCTLDEERNVDVRRAAAVALGEIPHEPALASAGLSSPDVTTRLHAAWAYYRWSRDAPPALEVLRDALVEVDPVINNVAADVLSRMGPAAEPLLDDLVRALDGVDPVTRQWAAYVLGRIGPAAAPAIPTLLVHLEDADAQVRNWSAFALGLIAGSSETVLPALAEHLDESDEIDDGVRVEAITAIGAYGAAAASLGDRLALLLDDPSPSVRGAAVTALARIAPGRLVEAADMRLSAGDDLRTWHAARGAAFAEASDWTRAVSDFQRVVELNPLDVGAYEPLIASQLAAGDRDGAAASCRSMLDGLPHAAGSDARLLLQWYTVFDELDSDPAPLIRVAEGFTAEPLEHFYPSEAWGLLGSVLLRAGRVDDAVRALTTAIQVRTARSGPWESALHSALLAMALHRAGDADGAAAALLDAEAAADAVERDASRYSNWVYRAWTRELMAQCRRTLRE